MKGAIDRGTRFGIGILMVLAAWNAAGLTGTSGSVVTAPFMRWSTAAPGAAGSSAENELITGTVTDSSTGEALASATVQVEGTYRGTITNAEGRFELRVPSLPVRLVIRFIGFETAIVPVSGSGSLEVRLVPAATVLPEIVVSGEDPAVRIMRRVIERKKEWRAELERFRADAYTRLVIENDTGIVSMTESVSDFWWDRLLGRREVLRGSRRSANLPEGGAFPAGLAVENLYDDDVELAGTRLMGVTHPDALDTYDVSLEGTRSLDGRTVFDISVRPRSRLASAFVGRVSVLDGEFALLEVHLRPGDSFLFPPPIQFVGIELTQQFASFGGPYMLPVDFRAEYELRFGIEGLLQFPTVRVRQISRLDGYEVNAPAADSVFSSEVQFVTDRTTLPADSVATSGTVVPLSLREAAALTSIDSTDTFDRAFRPTGALARFARVSAEGERSDRVERDLALDLAPEAWTDRVSGLHAEVGGLAWWKRRIGLGGAIGYDTAPRLVEWGVRAEAVMLRHAARTRRGSADARPAAGRPKITVFGRFDRGLAARIVSRTQDPFFNTVRVLFNGHDYFDYVQRDRIEAGLRLGPVRSAGLSLELAWRRDRDASVATGRPVRLVGTATQRPNPAVPEGILSSAVAKARIGFRPDDFGFTGATGAEVEVEVSPGGSPGADGGFVRASTRIDLRTETFWRRRFLPNVLDVALTASRAFGPVPPQRWGIVDGTGGWSSFGALRTLPDAFYEGDSHVFVGWEHHFRSVPFEMLGLRGLARRGYGLILTGAHGRTWLSDEALALARHVPHTSPGWHHEVGLSLTGILKIIRFDVSRRLDEAGWSVGFGTARLF